MTEPTTAEIKALSKLPWGEYGYADDGDLSQVVEQANSYIITVTGRRWETMPPPLEPIARQAVRIRTEQIVEQAQQDYADDANDDVILSLSAGGFSQTKADPNRRGEQRSLNSNPSLNDLLWLLLTTTPLYPDPDVDTMWAYWRMLLSGVNAPAGGVTEVDWSGSSSLPSHVLDNWARLL